MVINARFKAVLGAAIVALSLLLVPAALAQNSSTEVYGGEANQTLGVNAGGGPDEPGTTSSDSTLPFTGLDVSLLAGGGLILLLIGVGMAVAVPRHRHTPS